MKTRTLEIEEIKTRLSTLAGLGTAAYFSDEAKELKKNLSQLRDKETAKILMNLF